MSKMLTRNLHKNFLDLNIIYDAKRAERARAQAAFLEEQRKKEEEKLRHMASIKKFKGEVKAKGEALTWSEVQALCEHKKKAYVEAMVECDDEATAYVQEIYN